MKSSRLLEPVMRTSPLFVCVAAVALSGCASYFNSDYAVGPLDAKSMDGYKALTNALQAPPASGDAVVPKACFAANLTPATVPECTAARNQAMAALVMASETMCVDHRRTLYGNEAAWNIGLGTMTNLFAGAASVVSSIHGKSILAALALFSNSERSLINETVYKQMLVTAVDKKIVESREVKGRAFYDALKAPIDRYSMHEALRDLTAFHASCSFMTGLQKALDEGTQGGDAQKRLRWKAELASVETQMDGISVTDRSTTRKDQYNALLTRQKKISAALEALEGI